MICGEEEDVLRDRVWNIIGSKCTSNVVMMMSLNEEHHLEGGQIWERDITLIEEEKFQPSDLY